MGWILAAVLGSLMVASTALAAAWLPRRLAGSGAAKWLLGVVIGLCAGVIVVSLWVDLIPDSQEDSIAIALISAVALVLALHTYRASASPD